jgi:predicted nucleotidyltransferase
MADTISARLPQTTAQPSGRFLLRIDPSLHALLRTAAQDAGLSLNEYCARKLAAPVGNLAELAPAIEVVQRAAGQFGEALVAVALFGSAARGAMVESSDVDLLVVVDSGVKLTRELYRSWDQAPLSWAGHRVEQHLVHLPASEERVAGLWAEVALDGIVLFERGLALSTRLAQVRRAIADGHLVRASVHGQPYWKQVA